MLSDEEMDRLDREEDFRIARTARARSEALKRLSDMLGVVRLDILTHTDSDYEAVAFVETDSERQRLIARQQIAHDTIIACLAEATGFPTSEVSIKLHLHSVEEVERDFGGDFSKPLR